MDILDGANLCIGYAVNRMPVLMGSDADGIVIGILQIGLVGFVNIVGQALF